GVEEDADEVVAEYVFALAQTGADFTGRRGADKDDVEIFVIPADPGGGFEAQGDAVAGVALAKIFDAKHVRTGAAFEEVFDLWSGGDSRYFDVFDLSH